jgi:RHH-type rel operon transcriptional repressor/antitoxin RelB
MYDTLMEAPMLAIRLEKELEDRIAELASARGGNKSTVVREAVLRYLEDQEDIALARRAKKGGGRGKSIAEVRKALGLDR